MHESNIEDNNTTEVFAFPDELTPERRKMIENKLEHALLKALIQKGGEVVLQSRQKAEFN